MSDEYEVRDALPWAPGWGQQFYIGPGWVPIIKSLHEDLVKIDPEYKVNQVKEKFGGLRFYMETRAEFYEATDARVRQAEREADKTCDTCGGFGRQRQIGYWLTTKCDRCTKKAEEAQS